MELQTNDNFKSLISSKSFACSSHGVNWRLLGYESSKLEYLICAIDSGYDKKDILKERGYKWSNGDGNLPKTWWSELLPLIQRI